MRLKGSIIVIVILISIIAFIDIYRNGIDIINDYGREFIRVSERVWDSNKYIRLEKSGANKISTAGKDEILIEQEFENVTVKGIVGSNDIEIKYFIQANLKNNANTKENFSLLEVNGEELENKIRIFKKGAEKINIGRNNISIEVLVPNQIKTLDIGSGGYFESLNISDFPGCVKFNFFKGNAILNNVGSVEEIGDGNIKINN